MWNMETPDSDHDYMIIYQQSTKEILSGYPYYTGKAQHTKISGNKIYDCQFMEIGHLINLLIKGNINAIWIVTSPIIKHDSKILQTLREIVLHNLSKRSYDSLRGMSISQYNDAIKRPNTRENKAYKACLRILKFGKYMFDTGNLNYMPVKHLIIKEEIDNAFEQLDLSHRFTQLPNEPDESAFREFLYNIRISDL